MLLSLFLVQMNLKSCRIILYRVYMSIKSTSLLKLIILNFFLIIFVLCEKHIFNSTFCLTRDFLRISLRLRIFLWLFSTPLTVVFYPIFFLGFRANKVLLNWFENSIKQAATGNQQTIIGKSTRRLKKNHPLLQKKVSTCVQLCGWFAWFAFQRIPILLSCLAER